MTYKQTHIIMVFDLIYNRARALKVEYECPI